MNLGHRLYFESMEDRSVPAVTATLLGGGVLDINYTANNDTATLSTAGGNLSVVSNSGTTNFTIASVNAINAHSSSGTSQSITFGGNLNLSGQVTSTGLTTVTFFCGYSAAGFNINAKGTINVTDSLLGAGSSGDISLVTLVTVAAATNGALGSTANATAAINITGGSFLGAANITLDCQTLVTVDAEGDTASDTNRDFSRLTTTSSATILIEDQTEMIADGGILIFAKSKVTASATAEAKTTSTNAAVDAAVALNTVTSTARVEVFDNVNIDAVDVLQLTAINDTSMTTIADGTTSNATGKGGSVAIAKADKSTFVTVAGTIGLDADDIGIASTSITNSTTTALSSVGGSTANDASTTSELSSAGATTADGAIGVSAAVAINRLLSDNNNATVNMAGVIGTRGSLNITANSTTNATVTANASNTGAGQAIPPAGVGVAVAINKGAPSHIATLTGTAFLNTPAITISALEPTTGVHNTTATSGVGASAVGVAGSFALTDIDKTSMARIANGFNNDVGNTIMTLLATGNSSETTNANAVQQIISGNPRFGVGAAAAFNRSNRFTSAEIQDGAEIIGGSWNLNATSSHATNTNATVGSAGGVATSPGVALAQNVNDTFARLGTGTSFLDFGGGSVVLAANHTGSTTVTTHGEVAGSNVAVGAVLAMADVADKAHVNIDRSVDASSINASANTSSFVSSIATGSAKGTSSTQTSNQQIDQQDNNASRPSAQTADGVFGAAAALGINIAISESRVNVANNVQIGVNGNITLASANETDTFAKGDASVLADSNQATAVGLAAALGINKSTITNEAIVGTNATLFATSLTMQATLRDGVGTHSAEADAVSGAGGRKVGVAGALALNVHDNVTQAVLKSGTVVNGLTGAAALSAVNRRIETAKASPGAGGGAGDSVGVGASVAINILDNTTKAELEANARIAQAASLSIAATSVETVLTDAKGGAGSQTSAGAVAITPVVALTVLDSDTSANIINSTVSPTTVSGAANLAANHTGTTTTKAEGSTVATQVATGLSLAVSVEDVRTSTNVGRLTAGSASAVASTIAGSVMSAKASAKGGETSSGTTVDQKVQSQKNFGEAQAGETHANSDSASSSEGAVTLAGAVAVRVGNVNTIANVVATGQLTTTTGLFTAQALENVDTTIDAFADTVGTGSQSNASGLGIAAAVGINSSTINTTATIGAGATVSTRGLTLQSTMTPSGGNSVSASDVEAVSGAGNTGVGFAGALALNKDTHDSSAILTATSTVGTGLGTHDLTILADNATTANANARASTVVSKVGVGASVAINNLNRTTHAEIASGVGVTGSDDGLISAASNHTATTSITVGNSGGTAVSPGVALGIVNSSTFASTGTGSQITAPGFLSISASHIGLTNTTAHGETNGSNVAVGAVLALNDINDKSNVTLARSLNYGTGIVASTNTKSTSIADAFASSKGTSSTQQADAQIDQQRSIADRDSAETAEGKLAAAAALGVNIARSESKTTTAGTITLTSSFGGVTLNSANETDSTATGDSTALADGSANPTVGVAVGLGLNKTVITNEASLAGTTTANSLFLNLSANMRDGAGRHDSLAAGSAGAGGKKVGIAGSLGLNILNNQTIAALRGSSVANTGTGPINITATNRRNETARATPRADGGSGTTVGVGASVAINVIDNVTRAEVENGARISAAGATSLTANSVETVLTDSTGGSGRQDSAGNVTITPTVALSVVDDVTLARVGTSTVASALAGPLTLNATHNGGMTTSAVGTTTASGVAVGMSIAVAVEKIETKATVGKANVTGANAVTMNANSQTTSNVIAKSSAKGGESSATPLVDVKVSQQKNFADSESGTTHTSANSAQTSDGSVNVAGAVGVRVGNVDAVAGVESSGVLFSGSSLTITAKQNADVALTVDGLAVGTGSQNGQPASGLGIAAAIAINTSTTNTEAKIGDAALVTVRGLQLETGVLPVGADTTSTTTVSATSGIGNSSVGVAGSLALNVDRHFSTAKVDLGAAMSVGTGTPLDTDDLTLIANNDTSSSATATAKITGSGGSTKAGVGASVALEIAKVETIAVIETNASFGGSDDVSVTATGTHLNNATAEAGSAGAVAVSPAVALVVATGDTIAQVKSGANTTLGDDLSIQATRTNTSTSVSGATAAAGDVAVGVAIALTVAEDDCTATLDRNITSTTGTVDVVASNTSAAFATSTASSKGGPTAGDDSDQATQNQQDFGQNLSGGGTGGSNFSTKVSNAKANLKSQTDAKGGTDVHDNSNAFAAAIAVNVTAPTTTASITNTTGGRNISVGGAVTVRTDVDTVAEATANGTAVSGGVNNGTAIGAALGVNVAVITNTAKIGSGIVTASGITVRADHGVGDNHSFRAEAIAGGGGGQTSVAASLALNVVDDNTLATAETNADLNSAGAVLIRADNDIRLLTIAGGAAASLGQGVGAALSGNVVVNNTTASTGVTVTVDAIGSMTVEADASVAPMTGELAQDPMAVAAGGAGSTGGNSFAGSAAVNVVVETTKAFLDTATTTVVTAGAGGLGDLTIRSTDATTLKSGGGTVVATAGKGFGAGIAVDVLTKTVEAYIASTININVGIDVANDVLIDANSSEVYTGIAAALSFTQGTGIAGGAVVYVPTTTTRAFVSTGRVMQSTGNFTISANHDADLTAFSGAVSAGASNSVGIGLTAIVATDTVEAFLGAGAQLTVRGATGLSVDANNAINVNPRAVGGSGTAGSNMAGSGNATVLTEIVMAHIDTGVNINATNATAGVNPGVVVQATHATAYLGIAGTASGAGSVGAGAGADTFVATKTTLAWIDQPSVVVADGDIKVLADSDESIKSVAAALSGGGSAALAGAASVIKLNLTTRAILGENPAGTTGTTFGNIHASNNVIVSANDDTQVDGIAGNASGSGSASIGAAAVVPVINKLTEAFIGARARVIGDGNLANSTIKNGIFAITFANDVPAFGEVTSLSPANSDQDGDGLNDIADEQFAHSRLATAQNATFRGIGVSATSTDDIEALAIGGAVGGSVAVNAAAPVAVLASDTFAYIRGNAQVNADQSAASANQSVFVMAGSDQSYLSVAGVGAISGVASFGPAANVLVVNNQTKAFIDVAAQVNATDFVTVNANAKEDILMVAAGVAGSGTVGVAGSVNVLKLTTFTDARISNGAIVLALDTVTVKATDTTEIDAIAGAAGIGFAGVGVGAGVSYVSVAKDTNAAINPNAVVDGKAEGSSTATGRGVVVAAIANETVHNFALAAGGGLIGIGGGVGITVLDSDVLASIESGVQVNRQTTGESANQNVEVTATNVSSAKTIAGGFSLGVGALAGGIDVGAARNDVTARVRTNSQVDATRDILVKAISTQSIDSHAISGAGGGVALAASVGVWSLGSTFNSNYSNDAGSTSDALRSNAGAGETNDKKFANHFVGKQANDAHGQISGIMHNYKKPAGATTTPTPIERLGLATDAAGTDATANGPTQSGVVNDLGFVVTPAGTQALIEAGVQLNAGDDIEVSAIDNLDVDLKSGVLAGGVVGLGAAVSIANLRQTTNADVAGSLGAVDDITILAQQTLGTAGDQSRIQSFAGNAGFVGLGAAVSVINDQGVQKATLQSSGAVIAADSVAITSSLSENVFADAKQAAVGFVAGGATFTRYTKDTSDTANPRPNVTEAVVLGDVSGVNSLALNATQSLTVSANSKAVAGGVVSGTGSFTEVNVRRGSLNLPSTKASINSSNVDVAGNVTVNAGIVHSLTALTTGISVGVLTGGASKSTIFESQIVEASLFDSTISAGGNVVVGANATVNPNAQATSAQGALVVVGGEALGSFSSIDVLPIARASIGESIEFGTMQLNVGGNISLTSNVSISPHSHASSDSTGLVGTGRARARANVSPGISASTSGEVEITAAGSITLAGNLTSTNPNYAGSNNKVAFSKSTADAFLAEAIAVTSVEMLPSVDASIGDGAILSAGGLVQLDAKIIDIDMLTDASSDGDGLLDTTSNATNKSRIGAFSSRNEEFVNGAAVTSGIGAATVTGSAVEVLATVEHAQVYAVADSVADHGHVTPNSVSWAQMSIFVTAEIDSFAQVRGDDHIDVKAKQNIVETRVISQSFDVGITDRDTITEAQNTQTTTSRVFGEIDALLTTRKLTVEAINVPVALDTIALLGGDEPADAATIYKPARSITWNSDVHILSAANPILIIDANGNVTTAINAAVANSTATDIFVAPISNGAPFTPYEPIVFKTNKITAFGNTRQGTIEGFSAEFTFIRTFDTVTIQNYSSKNLVIDNMGVINNLTPTVVLDVEDLTAASVHFSFFTFHAYNPTVITIENLGSAGSPDIVFDSILNNPIGELHVNNPRGDILAQGRNSHTTSKLFLTAAGDIGSAATRMKFNLIQSAESSIVVSATAGANAHLDFKGFLRQLPGSQSFVIPIATLSAGGNIDLRMQDAQKQVVENPSRPSTNVNEIFPPPTTTVNVLGRYLPPVEETLAPLPLGVFGTNSVQIDSTYSFANTSAGGDFEATAVGGFSVVTLTGVINMTGAGLMQLTHLQGSSLTLNGGTGNNSFSLDDWGGAVVINGQAGIDTLSLTNFDGTVQTVDQLALQGVSNRAGSTNATIQGSVRLDEAVVFNVSDIAGFDRDLFITAAIAGAGRIIKQGVGGMSFIGNNSTTYFGIVQIDAGYFAADGNMSASQVLLNGGTLAGTGVIGPVSGLRGHVGTVSPGINPNSPFNLAVGQLSFVVGNVDLVQLNGTTAGVTYDQIDVNGSVLLGGATLTGTLGFSSAVGDVFRIIDNDGTDAVIGTFLNLPEGAFFFIGSVKFQISYVGGTGNDVILTHVNTNSAFGNRSITARTDEGNLVTVSGNIVEPDPLDSFTLLVAWGDGTTETFQFAPGTVGVTIQHRYLDNTVGGGQYAVFMDWRDQHGGGNQTTLFTQIDNVAPTLTLGAKTNVLRGLPQNFTFTADDVSTIDRAANFRFAINWGDGTTQYVVGSRLQQITHNYKSIGTYEIQVTAFDKDNAASALTTQTVQVRAYGMTNGELAVAGTPLRDVIVFQPANAAGDIRLTMNGVDQGVFSGVQRIAAYGGDGNDAVLFQTASIAGKTERINVPVFADGGPGADFIFAAGTAAGGILLGGPGNDRIDGGLGDDTIEGGTGVNLIRGGGGADVVTGSTSPTPISVTALDAAFAESRRPENDRVSQTDFAVASTVRRAVSTGAGNRGLRFDDFAVDQVLCDFATV